MGFSSILTSLSGPVTGVFNEPRLNGCPHKGLDIGSSGVSQPYTAGIYGIVVPPATNQSQWCTIAIQPFHDSSAVVQYLHSSNVNVSIGDRIAPWTILGSTGNCSPVQVPIHLHIQVAYPGAPANSCWNQNFVDPQSWPISSPVLGTWSNESPAGGYNYKNIATIDTDASSGTIGRLESSTTYVKHMNDGSQCPVGILFKYDLIATAYAQKNSIKLTGHFTGASIVDPNPCNLYDDGITSDDFSYELSLDSANGFTLRNLADGSFSFYTKGAGAMAEPFNVQDEIVNKKNGEPLKIKRTFNNLNVD